jgi:hypothetical protein
MDTRTVAEQDVYYKMRKVLGILDIGFFAEQEKNVGYADH